MFRLRYTVETTLQTVRQSPGLSIVTIFTIGAALLVLGAYVAGLQNLEHLAFTWGRAATVSAYVESSVDISGWESLAEEVRTIKGVRTAEVLTPDEALRAFRQRGPEAASLVEGIHSEILPASIEIDLESDFAALDRVERIALEIGGLDGIADVDYGQREFDRLKSLVELLRFVGLAAGLFVLAATAFIISNTIRLTVFARRDEIQILSLVGATNGFVRAPFLLEGAIWGLAGGLSAMIALLGADSFLATRLSNAVADILGGLQVSLFTPRIGIAVVIAGVVMGIVGSSLAVSRFLLDAETT